MAAKQGAESTWERSGDPRKPTYDAFDSKIPHPGVRVGEAGEDRRYNEGKVGGEVRAQGYGRCREAKQATVSARLRVGPRGEKNAELIHDDRDAGSLLRIG